MKIEKSGEKFCITATRQEMFVMYECMQNIAGEMGDSPESTSFRNEIRSHLTDSERWDLHTESSDWYDAHRDDPR